MSARRGFSSRFIAAVLAPVAAALQLVACGAGPAAPPPQMVETFSGIFPPMTSFDVAIAHPGTVDVSLMWTPRKENPSLLGWVSMHEHDCCFDPPVLGGTAMARTPPATASAQVSGPIRVLVEFRGAPNAVDWNKEAPVPFTLTVAHP